eukprot:TRINITY_DN198_c1_g1_i9.p1 TRINITY_DN198_c1_g1~~TRINITY_DN198_c1_g1_i9.p1  ORF type:complete len:253 (-),score=34.55 TRINITY_DN198_c1_g1_i9:282-1040(-)
MLRNRSFFAVLALIMCQQSIVQCAETKMQWMYNGSPVDLTGAVSMITPDKYIYVAKGEYLGKMNANTSTQLWMKRFPGRTLGSSGGVMEYVPADGSIVVPEYKSYNERNATRFDKDGNLVSFLPIRTIQDRGEGNRTVLQRSMRVFNPQAGGLSIANNWARAQSTTALGILQNATIANNVQTNEWYATETNWLTMESTNQFTLPTNAVYTYPRLPRTARVFAVLDVSSSSLNLNKRNTAGVQQWEAKVDIGS